MEELEKAPITEHLEELRSRILKSAIAILIATVASYPFSKKLYYLLSLPLKKALPQGSNLIFIGVTEAFFTYIKVSLLSGVVVSSPYVLYQIWAFVAPGLYPHEKRVVKPLVSASTLFFLLGVSFGYFVVFPYGLKFLLRFGGRDVVPMPSIGLYFSFAVKMLIAFGVIFELPVVTFFLSKFGIVSYEKMKSFRKYAVVLSLIVGAILTPPDVVTQILLAMPLLILYEISVWVAKIFGRKE